MITFIPSRGLKLATAAALLCVAPMSFALDLIESYQAALGADPTLLGAQAEVEADREKRVQGNALLLPQITAIGSYRYIDDTSETNLPAELQQIVEPHSSGQAHQAEVQLTQPLYDAAAWAQRRQLHEQTRLAEISFSTAQQALMQRVSEAYFGVLLAEETLRVTQAEKRAVQTQRDRAEARNQVGRSTITDVQESQARFDAVLADEVTALSTLAIRQSQYLELTGRAAEQLLPLKPELVPVPPDPDSLQVWQTRGLDHSQQVQGRRAELSIARAEIRKHKLIARPTLDLVASYAQKGQVHAGELSPVLSPDDAETGVVGVQLTLPLYTGGQLGSKLRESKARERQAALALSAAERDTRLAVQDAYLAVKTGVARISALEQAQRSAQSALDATVLGRDLGSRSEPDVLDAQQRLFRAQRDLASARNDYLIGRIKLAAAVGELQPRDLVAINSLLGP